MFFELMLGFYSLDSIQNYMKRTKVMTSPVTLLLALNVVGAGIQSVADGVVVGAASYTLVAFTALFSLGIFYRKTPVTFETFDILSNTQMETTRQMKMMLSGIMPAIYASFILIVIKFSLMSFIGNGGELLVIIAITPFVTLFFTKQITALQFDAAKLEEMSQDLRVYPKAQDVRAFYQDFINKCNTHSGLGLAFLISLGFYSDGFIGEHAVIIGGVGWLLVWSAFDDLITQYRNLCSRG